MGLASLKIRLKRVLDHVEKHRIIDSGLLLGILAIVLLGAGTTLADLSFRYEQRSHAGSEAIAEDDSSTIAHSFMSLMDRLFGTTAEDDGVAAEDQPQQDDAGQDH